MSVLNDSQFMSESEEREEAESANEEPPAEQEMEAEEGAPLIEQEMVEQQADIQEQQADVQEQQADAQEELAKLDELVEREVEVEERPQVVAPSIPTPEKYSSEGYINKLEQRLVGLTEQVNGKTNLIAELRREMQALKQLSSLQKKEVLDVKFKQIKLIKQRENLAREIVTLKAEVQHSNTKLAEFQEIGDINLLKARVSQLQAFCAAQQSEIEELRRRQQTHMVDEADQDYSTLMDQRLRIIEHNRGTIIHLEGVKQTLQSKVAELEETLIPKLASLTEALQLLNEVIQQQKQREEHYEETISNYEHRLQNTPQLETYTLKIQELEGKLAEREAPEKAVAKTEAPLGLALLTTGQQRDAILREYLALQDNFDKTKSQLSLAKTSYSTLLKEYRSREQSSVPKKSYLELLAKYKKAKCCLQSALKRTRELETGQCRKQSEDGWLMAENSFQGVPASQFQAVIESFDQKIIHLSEQSTILNLKQELQSAKDLIAELQTRLRHLTETGNRLQYILSVYDKEVKDQREVLCANNTLISELHRQLSGTKDQDEWRAALSTAHVEIDKLKTTCRVYETKCMVLLQKSDDDHAQAQNWRSLHEKLKAKYEEFLEARQHVGPAVRVEVVPQQQFRCEKCATEVEEEKKTLLEEGVQTNGISQLQFKETKQLILQLKRVNKSINGTPELIDKLGKSVSECRAKYDQVHEKYGTKFMALKKEKAQNQEWKAKMREEVRKEFQEISEMLADDRMLNAFRKAKYLIEYFQKQEVEEGEAEIREEE